MAFWTARRTFKVLILGIALLVSGWGVTVLAVAAAGEADQAAPADAIAVLGAAQYNGHPSPVFRARLDHAAALYRRGLAPVVLLTGGVGMGDTLSEADVGRRYLIALGIPADSTVALPAGVDTYASLAEVGAWFSERGSRRVVLVSDGFHLLRLRIIAARLGLTPFTSPARGSPIRASRRRYVTYLAAEGVKVPFTWLFHR